MSPFPTPLTTLSPRFAFRSFAFLFSRPELLLFSIVLNRRNDRCVPLFRRPTSASPRRKEEKKESVVGTMPSNDLMLISGSPAFSDSYCNDFLFDPFAYPSWLSLLLVCVQPVGSSPWKFSRFLVVSILIFSSIVSPGSNTGFDGDHFWKSIRNLDNLSFACIAFSLSLFFFCIRKNISSSSHDILIIGINYSGLYREPFQSKQWHGELSPCEPTVSSVTCPCVSFTYRHRSSRAGLFIRHLNTISLAVHRFLKKPSF